MRQRLFKKYLFTATASFIFCLTVIMIIMAFVYNSYLAKDKYDSLDKSCEGVAEYINSALNDNRVQAPDRGLYYIMNNIARVDGYDIMITDSDGVVKLCVCNNSLVNGECEFVGKKIKSNISNIVKSKNGGSLDTLGIYKSQRYVSAIPLNSSQTGFIIATASATGVRVLMQRIARIYLLSAAIPIVLMFFALYTLSYRFTKPLKLMSQAAQAMAKGDFSRRIPVTSDDEIGELAVSFNQMTEALVQIEKMRRDFIANISHELKTPMTSIGGFVDGIIDGTIPPEKQGYYLQLVSEEVKRLSRMTEAMLSVSRLESSEFKLKKSQFDFSEMLLNIVIGQEQRIAERNYKIEGLDTITPIFINADKDLIYRVIYNLVDNAIKFTDESGTISFTTSVGANNFTFKIENTGDGIPPNELPHVFERFYKGDKSRSKVKDSTGLGLYIVKTIVKNHGGTINVSSVQNKFTSFVVTLPIGK